MSSDSQEGEFTEVHRKRKKRKTASSPTLPPSTLQRTRSSEPPPETPTRPKTSTLKNQIPVILSNIDEKFQTWRLDLNKISYAKAERYKSKRDGRVLPMFQLEISDPAEAEALLSQNLMCNVTGIVYKVEEFRQPVSVRQCFNCQCFGHSAQNCKSKQKCVICGENHSHKGCPKKK